MALWYHTSSDPGYPERILAAAQAQVRHRLRRIDRYRDLDVPEADIHVWQLCIVQAGAVAEHTITGVRYTTCEDDGWIGEMYDYGHTEPVVTEAEVPVGGSFLTVRLPASTRIRLTLRLALRTRTPSYRTPFDTADRSNSTDFEGDSA